MQRTPSIIFAVLLLLAGAARGQLLTQSRPIDGYAALVNDRVITVSDVMAAAQPYQRELVTAFDGAELERQMLDAYAKARDALVERALILEEFKQQQGQLPPRLVDDRMNEIIRERFGNDRAAFLKALTEDQVTPLEWREQVRDMMVVSLMRRQEIGDRVRVTPGEVRALYDKRKKTFSIPAKVKLRMILLNRGDTEEDRKAKQDLAEQVLAKLDEGVEFSELAKQYSEGGKAAKGGDWGWTDPHILRKELAGATEQLEPGQHSGVLEVGDDLYILQIEGRRNASAKPFEEVRDELEGELRQQEGKRLYDDWINRLRSKYFVKIY